MNQKISNQFWKYKDLREKENSPSQKFYTTFSFCTVVEIDSREAQQKVEQKTTVNKNIQMFHDAQNKKQQFQAYPRSHSIKIQDREADSRESYT